MSSESKKKRHPDRPKKIIDKKIVPFEGIVDFPFNVQESEENLENIHIMEWVCDQPMIFRKVFNLFKVMSTKKIKISFGKEAVRLYTYDHSKTYKLYVKFDGHKINHYYCKNLLEIGLTLHNIYWILKTINKEHSCIAFSISLQNCRSNMNILIFNDNTKDISKYDIYIGKILVYDWLVENFIKNEKHYPILFNLGSKHFKKMISNYVAIYNIIKIEKENISVLKIIGNFSNCDGTWVTSFDEPRKINLISMLEDNSNNIFSTSINLDQINLFFTTCIVKNIKIAAHHKEPMIFTLFIDQEETIIAEKVSNIEKIKKTKTSSSEKCIVKVIVNLIDITKNQLSH